ncbi:MAG: pseudoazurin [Rhodobacteraceae bacterium]|nr:pseudoazurin [Paracoccaceae bacterium]
MSFKLTRRNMMTSTAAVTLVAATRLVAQDAQTVTVQMLNKHPENSKLRMVYYPRIAVVNPGDTVVFEATDRGHNSAAVEGMVPDGVELWDGTINEEISVTFDQPGIYGYECTPHKSSGMVGLIIVQGEGMLDNLEAAKDVRQRGKAKKVWEEIWEEVEAQGYLTEVSR